MRRRPRPHHSARRAVAEAESDDDEEDRVDWLGRLDDEGGLFGPLTADEQEEVEAERIQEVERELELLGPYQPEERGIWEEDEVWRMRKRLGLLGYGVGVRKTTAPGEAARRQERVARENAPEQPCGCGFGYTCVEHRAVQTCGGRLEARWSACYAEARRAAMAAVVGDGGGVRPGEDGGVAEVMTSEACTQPPIGVHPG